jgi:hypothetical protein
MGSSDPWVTVVWDSDATWGLQWEGSKNEITGDSITPGWWGPPGNPSKQAMSKILFVSRSIFRFSIC